MREITMLDYINQTPEIVKRIINNSYEFTKVLTENYINNDYDGILLIACGSSYNGCLLARYFIRDVLNCECKLITPFTFYHHEYKLHDRMMKINVSQSGCSTNILDCLKKLKIDNQQTICLTGRDDCDAKLYSDILVNWQVGEEKIGFVTKGVISLAAFLMSFALETALKKKIIKKDKYEYYKNQINLAMEIHPEIVNNSIKLFEENISDFTTSPRVYLVSSGPNLGTAVEAGLKISETSCISALTFEVEEYLHGPIYPLGPDALCLFIDNNDSFSSERIIEVAIANNIVSKKTYTISNSNKIDDFKAIKTSKQTDPLISPLYKLAGLQVLAYLMTENTNKYVPHPNIKEFKNSNAVVSKSRSNLYLDLQKNKA